MIKKILKITVLAGFAVFIVMQFFRPNFTNPPVNAAETLQAAMFVPENVQAILNRSCNDCHSNETSYPWYSRIQPSGSFLAGHIEEGRRELNFSNFNSYETSRKRRKLTQICEQVEDGLMPLPSYTWIHRTSVLTADDVKTICDWTKSEPAAPAGD